MFGPFTAFLFILKNYSKSRSFWLWLFKNVISTSVDSSCTKSAVFPFDCQLCHLSGFETGDYMLQHLLVEKINFSKDMWKVIMGLGLFISFSCHFENVNTVRVFTAHGNREIGRSFSRQREFA